MVWCWVSGRSIPGGSFLHNEAWKGESESVSVPSWTMPGHPLTHRSIPPPSMGLLSVWRASPLCPRGSLSPCHIRNLTDPQINHNVLFDPMKDRVTAEIVREEKKTRDISAKRENASYNDSCDGFVLVETDTVQHIKQV